MRPLVLQAHTRPLTRVLYTREGDILYTAGRDKVINCFYEQSGERIGTFEGHNGAVLDICVDEKTEKLVSGSADMTARLWDTQTGKCIYEWKFGSPVRVAKFSIGGKYILLSTIAVMNAVARLQIYSTEELSDTPIMSVDLTGAKMSVAQWGDLNHVIYSGHEDGTISMWDAKTGEKIESIQAHKKTIGDLQMSPDRTYFITASKDGTSKIYDSRSLTELKSFTTNSPNNTAAISPLHDHVAIAGGIEASQVTTTTRGNFDVRWFHKIYLDEMARVKGHFGPVNTIAFHPSGRSLTSGGEDGMVRVLHFDKEYIQCKV